MRFFARLKDEAGSQVVEFGLVLLPMMAFVFLIMDVAWVCFAQASLQHAVQVGVRTAVVNPVPKSGGQDAYLKTIVQQNAMGFLAGNEGLDAITINYYTPSDLKTAILPKNGGNSGGNVIEIVVNNVPVSSLGPILRESSPKLYLHASSSDVMEGSAPGTTAPTR